ncbi:helicase-associated domain-containing protein [Corynebacterium vitaeruminis]|uniref:helicase-associated domain-containing protein n=1 Tax=Corynebacterium vitaeruminis TaxID=38305 RepID=UPI00066034BF|nr:helicase-associated domain-containing protein [Corynebacterium vitaeruminis]
MTSTTPFALFSDWLASQPDQFVGTILSNRPDALSPPPKSSQVLAARLQLRASVSRALTKLPALELACIEAAADLGADAEPVTADALIDYILDLLSRAEVPADQRPTATHIRTSLDTLREHGLIWGNGPGPRGTFTGKSTRKKPLPWQDYFCLSDEVASSLPPGWYLLPNPDGPSRSQLRAALTEVTDRQQRLLDTLANAGGLGVTKDAHPDADPSLPVPALINVGLLERIDEGTVRLPATVRALMRGVGLADDDVPLRPEPPATHALVSGNDRAAATAWETLRQATDLLELLGTDPAPTLKNGVIGVRETRNLIEELGVDISELARSVANLSAAGLVHIGTPHPLPLHDTGGDYFAPTLAADGFLDADLVDRWVSLTVGTRTSDAAPWRVDQLNEEGKRIALLSPHTRLSGVPSIREMVLACCAQVASSASDNDVVALTDLRECAAYYYPITNARCTDEVLSGVVEELVALGIVVRDPGVETISVGLSEVGKAMVALIESGTAEAFDNLRAACNNLLPPNASYLMVQADNTIVVPGPASPEMERMLSSIAQLESPGLASVYRVTEDSLRDALDAGINAADISEFLSRYAVGEVPQSITYLLDDVTRRHGRLRGGPAASFIRCDDPALLASFQSHQAGQRLALRKIAETVLISQAPLAQVIETARNAGFSIIAEDAEGLVLDLGRSPCRIEAPAPVPTAHTTMPEPERISQALTAIADGNRAAEHASNSSGTRAGGGTAGGSGSAAGSRATAGVGANTASTDHTSDYASGTEAFKLLQRAARHGDDLYLSYVDRNGKPGRKRVRPVTVSGGQVDAIDPATSQVLRFLLHRITEVHPVD